MEIANASLLDEATAAAEAMTMLHRVQTKQADGAIRSQFFVADSCFPQTIELLKLRAEPLGIELVMGSVDEAAFTDRMFGALIQTPDEAGNVQDLRAFMTRAKAADVLMPDLARVGGPYSHDWFVAHMTSPRAVVPESVILAYPFLADRRLQFDDIAEHLKSLRMLGQPYTDEMIAKARVDLEAQVNPDADPTDLLKRYPRAVTGKFNPGSSDITELDALIAYLQMLGTLVSISDIPPERLRQ